jgi:hypothetical protein
MCLFESSGEDNVRIYPTLFSLADTKRRNSSNFSIRKGSLEALAAEIQRIFPELVNTLVNFAKEVESPGTIRDQIMNSLSLI